MIKSYKIRLYPTKEQEELFYKHIGCSRFIWNYMLALQIQRYENKEKNLSHFDMVKLLTPLKKQEEYKWLKEVSNSSLQIICGDLAKTYKSMFSKVSKKPKFKSKKKSKKSFPVRGEIKHFYFEDGFVTIQKIGKVKYKTNYDLPLSKNQKFTNPRISLQGNKWILSFGIECEKQTRELNDFSMGIDVGVKELVIVSYDDKHKVYKNINKTKKVKQLERKLKHIQRNTARKYDYNNKNKLYEKKYHKSNNILKSEKQAKKLYEKLTNIRQDYIHKMTFELVEILPKRIVIEDLNIVGMMKNRHLSKAIGQCKWGEIFRQLEYKCSERGIEVIKVDRFYPSSKLCSKCGNIKTDLKLSDRTYKCECGFEIDRDINASINLMNYKV